MPYDEEALKKAKVDQGKLTNYIPSTSIPSSNEKGNVQPNEGIEAALRVKKYGTLWDQIGTVINVLNSVGAVILFILLFVSGLDGTMILLGIVLIAILWGLSYLQISIIKGLASYFQMRSADYLEQKDRNR
jgi:hypothetical protein